MLQLGVTFFTLLTILFVFRDQLFEPEYKKHMLKALYTSNKERTSRGIKTQVTMQDRLKSAGMDMTPLQFYMRVYAIGFILIFIFHLIMENTIVNVVLLLICILIVPRLLVNFMISRRLSLFRERLPNALDAIIRGARAGLTISDCVQLVANDSIEPIRSEFKMVVQNQRVGMTLAESFDAMADRLVMKETRLLSFAIQIQQQSGGNISEILSNLANAIRAENVLKDKAKTVTTEGKVTTVVVSILPISAYRMVNAQNPEKMQLLFTSFEGNLILFFIIFWVFCGIAAIIYTVRIKV